MAVAGFRPVGSWLERFRRAAAVPAAAGEDLEAELIPVFAALSALEAEAAQVRRIARQEAERRWTEATAEAERIAAEARRLAPLERTRTEEAQRRAATGAAAEIEAAGRAEADRIRRHGRERLPGLAAEIVASLDALAPTGVRR